MVYQKGMRAKLFIAFFKRLPKSSKRKVFLIVDNLRAHKTKSMRKWIEEENGSRIEVHYLPTYSPELNPDEYLNNTLIKQLANDPPPKTMQEQTCRERGQMRSNQKRPGLISSLFNPQHIRYAV
jgi:hypothetical protein